MNWFSLVSAGQGALVQGILWGIMAIGVFLTFRVLNYPDMTADGSFALGGAVCATGIINGLHPLAALLIAMICGAAAGYITAFLHTVLDIPAILSGILTQISLYSINLRIMGRANTPLLKYETLFSLFEGFLHSIGLQLKAVYAEMILSLLFTVLVIVILYWFFGTEIGCAIRATGNNEFMVRAQGQNTNTTKLITLMLSNGLIAFSGGLMAMNQGFADTGMGVGAIVIGLASIVIGEVVLGHFKSFGSLLLSIIIGSIVYRLIIAIVLQLGLKTDDMKLLTATLVAVALGLPVIRTRLTDRRGKKQGGNLC
ncbi:MAG: ABC transporter permease [Lachnospiraceae bacterium]|nr:ABC transporter permease [Lachnospiraceae bacterium]MDY5742817.1 ABC transporter permease [Lachnospiraceae bacterium]